MKEKCVEFFKRHSAVFYTAISLLLVLFALLMFSLAVNVETAKAAFIDAPSFEASFYSGYSVETDPETGRRVYKPINNDPQVAIGLRGALINTVTVRFENELSKNSTIQLYYSTDGSLSEPNSAFGFISEDKKSFTVHLPEGRYVLLRFDIEAEFTIQSVSLDHSAVVGRYVRFNPYALTALLALLLLLSVFEKRIRYFSYIKSLFIGEFQKVRKMLLEKKYLQLAAHSFMLLSLLSFALTLVLIFWNTGLSGGSIVAIFILSVISVAALLFNSFVNGEGKSAASLFLLIALVIGLAFSFCLPPVSLVVWDDEIHYGRVLDILSVFSERESIADSYISDFGFQNNTYETGALDNIDKLLYYDSQNIASFRSFTSDRLYDHIAYIPPALILLISNAMGANVINGIILARLANLLICVLAVYFAILKLKNGGSYLAASVFFIPTTFFMASAMHYDAWITAFIIYAFACFISEMREAEKPFSMKSTLVMLLAFFVGCGPKAIYFLLLLPFVFVKNSRFSKKRNSLIQKIATVAVMLVIILSFVVPFFSDMDIRTDDRGGEGVDAGAQVDFILANPFKYAGILFKFLIEYISLGTARLYTVSYAYLGIAGGACGVIAIAMLLFCAVFDRTREDRFAGAIPVKAVTLIASFATLILVATSLYVSFTPVASETVNGCQYRYIIPMFFPVLYALGSVRIKNPIPPRYMNLAVFGILSLNLLWSFYGVYVSRFV